MEAGRGVAGAPGAARETRNSGIGVYGATGSSTQPSIDSTEEGSLLGKKGLRSRAVTRDDVVSGINLG